MQVGDLVTLSKAVDASVEYGVVIEVQGTPSKALYGAGSLILVHWTTEHRDYQSWVCSKDLASVKK
jgi:hypothetical protein